MDPYLKGKDPITLLTETAKEMGCSVQEIIDKSKFVKNGEKRKSMFFDPKIDEGKSQNWLSFTFGPDDVRTFGSANYDFEKTNGYTIQTFLHECLGHGTHGMMTHEKLPYSLQSHDDLIGETQGMLHESLMQNPQWLHKVAGLSIEKAKEVAHHAKQYHQAKVLCKTRSYMSIIEFEREMYNKPNQDLNELWWDLQKKYLDRKRPDKGDDLPTFARIPHLITHPVYIHNYFLGELMRAQILEYIQEHIEGGFLSKNTGGFLRDFGQVGNAYEWPELFEQMTGKPLGAGDLKKVCSVNFAHTPEEIQTIVEKKRLNFYQKRRASIQPKK